jgi:hypothetical protein
LRSRGRITEILSHALNTLGTVRLIGGDASGWADLDRSLQLALTGGFQEQVVGAYTNLAPWPCLAVNTTRRHGI